jgi:hypothetical protein
MASKRKRTSKGNNSVYVNKGFCYAEEVVRALLLLLNGDQDFIITNKRFFPSKRNTARETIQVKGHASTKKGGLIFNCSILFHVQCNYYMPEFIKVKLEWIGHRIPTEESRESRCELAGPGRYRFNDFPEQKAKDEQPYSLQTTAA